MTGSAASPESIAPPSCGALTAALMEFIIFAAHRQPHGVAAMMENVVRGLVVAGLILMVWLAFVQKHPEACLHGRLVKSLQPCGSLDTSI
jgi:hypothetical protein